MTTGKTHSVITDLLRQCAAVSELGVSHWEDLWHQLRDVMVAVSDELLRVGKLKPPDLSELERSRIEDAGGPGGTLIDIDLLHMESLQYGGGAALRPPRPLVIRMPDGRMGSGYWENVSYTQRTAPAYGPAGMPPTWTVELTLQVTNWSSSTIPIPSEEEDR